MLTVTQCLIIVTTVFGTSVLSGIFGVAGGLILMGVLASLLPVPLAMTAHGFAQLIANGTRFFTLRQHVDWKSSQYYILGMAVASAAFWFVMYSPSKLVLFLILGTIPLFSILPLAPKFDFQKSWHGFLCGLMNTSAHLTAGVSGPVLDLFFVNSKMNRFEIMATKSFTQVLGHTLKIGYFASMATAFIDLSLWIPLSIATAAILGTQGGSWVLNRMSEASFRSYLRRLLFMIGCVYLVKAALEI